MPDMPELKIAYQPIAGSKVKLTARLGDELLAIDMVDVAKASARARFAEQVCEGRSGIDRSDVDRELLGYADNLSVADEKPMPAEMDAATIARPEMFFTPPVCGVTVATRRIIGAEPVGSWELYLRWADGRRERRPLDSGPIELSDGGMIWLHPTPAAPSPTVASGWTARSRKAWLDGIMAPDPVDVFRRICERIAYHVELPSDSAQGTTAQVALWIMFTYVFTAWDAVPYLSLGGPAGSGKTTLLEIISRLAFRPLRSSSMTGPSLFRTLHERGGTLLLDEAERLRDHSPESGELRAMLLSGYKRGSPAIRQEKVGDGFKTRAYDVFTPKALACIARLPEALASRCIPIVMFRAGPGSPKPRRRIDEHPELWSDLRNDLAILALEYGSTWTKLAARSDVCPEMPGRAYELWQPLLSLAAWLDECGAKRLLGVMQRHAVEVIQLAVDDSTPPADEVLLRLLAEAVRDGQNAALTPGELLRQAREQDAELFRHWTARGVSAALGRYRIKATKYGGKRTYRVVEQADLLRLQSAYGIDLGLVSQQPSHPAHTDPEPSLLG